MLSVGVKVVDYVTPFILSKYSTFKLPLRQQINLSQQLNFQTFFNLLFQHIYIFGSKIMINQFVNMEDYLC